MSELGERSDFEELRRGTGLRTRISLQTGDGAWIDRSSLTGDGQPEEYILDVEDEGEPRYTLQPEESEERVVGWGRFVFPIRRKVESDEEEEVSDDLKVVIEVSDSGEVPKTTPWDSKSEVRFASDLLEKESGYDPVNADRVAGLEDEKQKLERFLKEAEEDWGLSESTGIILEGPPGTGKTELVMEVCQEKYGSIPVTISGPEILSKWVGESERMLREKFDEAWSTEHKVLYIDELDAIAQSRSEVSESYSAQIVAQLLVLLDGVESKEQSDDFERALKVVASTNLSHVVDPALRRPGRLGNRPIQFSRPDRTERKAILHHYLENVYVSEDGQLSKELKQFVEGRDLEYLNPLIKETEGFTGADIEDLIQEAVSRLSETRQEILGREFLKEVIDGGDFKAGQDFSEKELSQPELQAEGHTDVDYSSEQPAIHYLDAEDPAEVAKMYFRKVNQEEKERDLTYKFRKVSPKDILNSDSVRAREETVQAFQHRENERIALYLENAGLLIRGSERSSLIDRLIGIINEQFLLWEEENLLILPKSASNILEEVSQIYQD
ncbi:AAA family ATPase [Natrarchaeobaculum sulfurireducens]|uniref:ATPase of the AAA+ class, CDC48 family n=1 Tax=Natrarchaeobaculum sulfurireducens TaxID=2044521 RepID=A0A346PD82_9EURY|nr:ATP-binding protein [Natrarchaeobaculum sulfurireducens]AXR77477.1 ATPase of the AAA+ class, CDC48 family [Natrarchaeobaculum sulfurireducens]